MSDNVMELLKSQRSSERLRGARMLMEANTCPPMAELRRLREREPDSWVRSALDRAIRRWQDFSGVIEIGQSWISTPTESDSDDLRAEAVQAVTRTILHEIRPLVSDIQSFAREAIGEGFALSPTARSIDRIRSLIDTIQRLNEAAAPPRAIEFDLANLIIEEVTRGSYTPESILPTRRDPVIVHGDPDLLILALRNVIRNAVEASEGTENLVIINCGATDSECWVVVLDEGVGLPEASERVWEPGITKKSKEDHFGWGLTIAQRAVHSMKGSIRLTPREHGGTSCEIRWASVRDFGGES